MPNQMKQLAALATAAAVAAGALSACGGGSDQTAAAATCLRNSIAQQATGDQPGNCGDTIAWDATKQVATSRGEQPFTVTCTHQNANQYVCDVKDPDGTSNGHDGFYNVTYDGHSIVYQPGG